MYDVLIKGGIVVDGSGGPRYEADVALQGHQIVKIGRVPRDEAKRVIDAQGKIVAPGFIDHHSHSDWVILMGYDGANILEQGITTEIGGNCGLSLVPYVPADFDEGIKIPLAQRERIEKAGGSVQSVIAELESSPIPVNIAMYIGQGNVRGRVMGYSDRQPTSSEMNEMRSLVQEGMEAGALGLSTGLIYPPGIYTSREEIESLCKVVADFQGSYTSHMRSEGDNVVEAVQETLDVGKTCGIPVTISHHKVVGAQNEGKSQQTLALVNEAVNNGQIVYVDQYPYEGAGASLLMVIPPMFATEGPAVLLNKLKDPTFRNQLSGVLARPGEGYTNLLYETTPERLLICGLNSHPELDGLSVQVIAQKLGKDLYETLFDILCENSEAQAIFLSNCLSDMESIMRHPLTMPGIDGMQSENKNPQDHPRVNATFPKIIGTYCRDYGFFPLEECIRKMTSLPARSCNFTSKGILLEGKDADITIFDYDRINGPATYGRADLPNEGIEYVIVNGIIAVKNGRITKQRAGKFIRRM